jgi:hypothetical protein
MEPFVIISAWNKAFEPVAKITKQWTQHYCKKKGIPHSFSLIPDDYPRPASWFKIEAIRSALHYYRQVLWIDADAYIDGAADIRDFLRPNILNIALDQNGINCGVMAWHSEKEAFRALERIYKAYPKFEDHPWFEQAALMEFVDELDYHEQRKVVFNAYPGEFTEETLIYHWPGMEPEARLQAIQEHLEHKALARIL